MRSSTIKLIYVIAFMDLLAASMVSVMLPNFLKTELGVSATLAGAIGSLYGFVQFFSCPLAGGWSDVHGFSGKSQKNVPCKNAISSIINEFRSISWSDQWDLFATKFLLSSAVLLYRSSYGWLLTDRFDFSAANQSFLTSYQGLVSFMVAFNVKTICSTWTKFTSKSDHSKTDINLHIYSDATVLMAVSILGLIFGLNASFTSISRCLAPFFGGLLHDYHLDGCAWASFCLIFASYFVTLFITSKVQHRLIVNK
uniref:Uncharacterized protein n=1 Tax=Romanomermis culicivorax TaxID=13658 RepID=A0A915IM57_ROMCU